MEQSANSPGTGPIQEHNLNAGGVRPPVTTAQRILLRRWLGRLRPTSQREQSSAATTRAAKVGIIADLIVPLLGIYAGQLLLRVLPKASTWGMSIIAASVLLLVLRLRFSARREPMDWFQIAIGLSLILPLALDVQHFKQWTSTLDLIAIWLAGVFLVIAAVVRFRPQPLKIGLQQPSRLDRFDWLALALLVAGALLLRVPSIETIPMGVDPDEASLGLSAVDAATGAATDPFAAGWATHPTLEFFINGQFIRLFGRTFFALRLPSALAGTAMVAALYLLARITFGRRVALLAALLALGSDVAIHFSRLGLNNNGDSLFMVWTLGALWFAGVSGKAWGYALAGFGMGFAQYFYFGNRAIPFVVLATLVIWLVADRRGMLRSWRLLAGFALVTLAVGGPLFGHWLRNPGSISEHLFLAMPFSTKMQEEAVRTGLSVSALWWRQIRDSLLVFTAVADRGTFYHPQQAMLHPAQIPFFLVGLLALFSRLRRPVYQALLGWILVVLALGSVLITDAATFHRLLGVLPAAILVVAIGIDAGVDTLERRAALAPGTSTRIAAGVVAVLVATTVHFYFGVYNVHQAYKTPTQEAVTVAALEYQRAQGQGTFLLYTWEGVDPDGKVYHSPIGFVADEAFRGGGMLTEAALQPGQPVYFYVLPDRQEEIARLMEKFPGGTLSEYHRRSDDRLLMTRYAVVP